MKTYNVSLVSVTEPLVGPCRTAEELIAYVARVSNPGNQMNTATTGKLLKYLWENKHYSPFEMADLAVEIVTSRGLAPQILRHWSFSFQEFSQRYAEVQEYIEYPARRQDSKNRQNSVDDLDDDTKQWFIDAQKKVWEQSFSLYQESLAKGIAKEQARFLLPLNTKTVMYMKGNLRDWMFYLQLRSGNGTQREHQEIAKAVIHQIFVPNFPIISEVLGWTNV